MSCLRSLLSGRRRRNSIRGQRLEALKIVQRLKGYGPALGRNFYLEALVTG